MMEHMMVEYGPSHGLICTGVVAAVFSLLPGGRVDIVPGFIQSD